MTPAAFLRMVVDPNVDEARRSTSLRAVFNAVLTLDALAGIIHAHGKAAGVPAMVQHAHDESYKGSLAAGDDAYQLVRDLAAATKHGELTRNAGTRLVTKPGAVRSLRMSGKVGGAPLGRLPLGSGPVIFVYIECAGGRSDEIAGPVIERAHAMLAAIVEGLPAA